MQRMVSFMPCPLYPWEGPPEYPVEMMLNLVHRSSDVAVKKVSLPPPTPGTDFQFPIIQPVASQIRESFETSVCPFP
jgi:hypothetical protein